MTLKHWEPTTQMIAPHAQFEYFLGGVDYRRDSADVPGVAFESANRVRTPTSWKHKKNYTGHGRGCGWRPSSMPAAQTTTNSSPN